MSTTEASRAYYYIQTTTTTTVSNYYSQSSHALIAAQSQYTNYRVDITLKTGKIIFKNRKR